jgi:membrane protease YdiL (CAAX protease family)
MATPPQTPRYGAPIPAQPAGPSWSWAWLLAAILIVPAVVFLQQYTLSLESVTLEHAPRERTEAEEPEDPGIRHFTIESKILVQSAGPLAADDDRAERTKSLKELEDYAISRADRLRLAIVAGELLGPAAATDRLTELKSEAAPGGDLAHEIDWLLKLYEPNAPPVPADVRAALLDRHGWFGALALAYGKPQWDSTRRAVMESSSALGTIVLWVLLAGLLSLLAGIVVLILFIRMVHAGDFDAGLEPLDHGESDGIYLEIFVLFSGGFLLLLGMRLVSFGMGAEGSMAAIAFLEALSWVLVGSVAWPLIRRADWGRFAEAVGLTRGEGLGREIGVGAMTFLAWLPVLLLLVIARVITSKVFGGADSPQAHGYPLFEPPRAGGWTLVWLGALGAVVWAPLIEEIIFRGALFRYLRPRLRLWGAVIASAAVFASVHPYTPSGWISVGLMGVVLALLREWRGSLVAGMTVHALHNGAITLVSILYLWAMS